MEKPILGKPTPAKWDRIYSYRPFSQAHLYKNYNTKAEEANYKRTTSPQSNKFIFKTNQIVKAMTLPLSRQQFMAWVWNPLKSRKSIGTYPNRINTPSSGFRKARRYPGLVSSSMLTLAPIKRVILFLRGNAFSKRSLRINDISLRTSTRR